MSAGTIAAATAHRAERRLVEHLRNSGAVSPDSASSVPAQRWMGKRVLRRLIQAGVIRQVGTEYYLDEAAYSVHRARRHRLMLTVIGVLVVVVSLAIWWASRRG